MNISIEVIYAQAHRQERVTLELPSGTTALEAAEASGLLRHLPAGTAVRLGVWGKPILPQTRLHDRDRVEICRPLIANPMESRRHRAAKAGK